MQHPRIWTYRGPGGLKVSRQALETAAAGLDPLLSGQIVANDDVRTTAGFLPASFGSKAGLLLRMAGRLGRGSDAALFLLDREDQIKHAFTIRQTVVGDAPLFLTMHPTGKPMGERSVLEDAFNVGMGRAGWAQPMPWVAALRAAAAAGRSNGASSC